MIVLRKCSHSFICKDIPVVRYFKWFSFPRSLFSSSRMSECEIFIRKITSACVRSTMSSLFAGNQLAIDVAPVEDGNYDSNFR